MLKKHFLLFVVVLYGFISLTCVPFGFADPNSALPATPQDNHQVFLPTIVTPSVPVNPAGEAWPMVAGNAERTSWSLEQVSGNLQVSWYRPIEAYIPQNSQIIANHGKLYVATSAGLYVFNATDGNLAWRFDTEMPLGHSPAVVDGVVYVAGYDRKLHALDAQNGRYLWSYNGAKAGFDTSPLVVNGRVFVGNRDGAMYAIGAHNSPSQGQLLWKYQTGGPIHLSAAYRDNVIYFAANDNYAYALRADTGDLVWRSAKLPGDGYHSYWPVIYQDQVIFSVAPAYRGSDPGMGSINDPSGNPYGKYHDLERDDLFPTESDGVQIGPEIANQSWANGKTVLNASRITNYHEQKPWRRVFVALNLSNGQEYTFDSDGDGRAEYIPAVYWGTQSGNRYPPIVGPDNTLYFSNLFQKFYIPQGRVVGWQPGLPYLSQIGGQGAVDEPQAISGGGDMIYRSVCCDRVGDYFSAVGRENGTLWTYNRPLTDLAPGYDQTWTILPGWPRLNGWYKANTNSVNAAYHNHGDQNPLIPYQGMMFIHRSNAIIAFGPNAGPGRLNLLAANNPTDAITPLTQADLTARLTVEVEKIIATGGLRPGYYQVSQFLYPDLKTYFENPGDTLYTLSMAYPHLSPALQAQLRTYLQDFYDTYFESTAYVRTGWMAQNGREAFTLPPEVSADLNNHPGTVGGLYPPRNFYALWRYATILPVEAGSAYNLAKSKLVVPVPSQQYTTDYFTQNPYMLNDFIAGYTGFLELQDLAGMSTTDGQLRTQVTNELNRLLQLRVTIFSKDSYWLSERFHKKHLDIARNFIYLTPELADHMDSALSQQVRAALAEYEQVAPYWFVSRYEATIGEGVMSNLYNYHALFLARAYILNQPRAELTKYLDVPAFATGDLFYIQNLVAALEAP